jgi:hypothetical protein
MPHIDSSEPKRKKLLIITSSGGGGLIQAAIAKEQEALAKDPNLLIVKKDVLKDWMGSVFGNWCSGVWNRAQIKGNIAELHFFIASQRVFDYFCWPYLFIRSLLILFKENVDAVIDTQPFGTSAMLKAIRIYNKRRNKQLRLQKVLVDLPTKAATHFFRPIKRLAKKDRLFLQLTTIAPLLEDGQTAEEFWQTNCRLSEKEIHYEDVYVRQSFRKYQNKKRNGNPFPLVVRFKNQEELSLMKKTFGRGSLKATVKDDEIHFSLSSKDRLMTILLGSQPSSLATFNYVKKFVQLCSEKNAPKTRCHIFVFCSEHQPNEQSLFKEVAEYVGKLKKYPGHVTVVPFSFQKDDCIAPLFFRSDLTCTRSGGQTAMELMCVSTAETWIHSETKKAPEQKEPLSLSQLLEGIPGWEAANALYLSKVHQAKVVTPETLAPLMRQFFLLNSGAAHSNRSDRSTS